MCEEGHLLQGYIQESIEAQDASQHVTTRRSVRKNRALKHRVASNDHFHGDRALFLQAQALQLILRHQLKAMTEQLGFPAELEGVCRDMWGLLAASAGLPAAPRDYERGEEAAGSYSGPREGARYVRKGARKGKGKQRERREKVDGSEDDESRDGSDVGGSPVASVHSSDIEDSESEEDPMDVTQTLQDGPHAGVGELPTPLATVSEEGADQATTPAPSPEDPNPFAPPPRTGPKKWHQSYVGDPRKRARMDHLLLILYLGCVTLRLPVFLHDIVR